MRPYDKNSTQVIIEVSIVEMHDRGFDSIWDEIRSCYPEHQYEMTNISKKSSENLLFITLKIKKLLAGIST